jgi:site-specific DNA-methyltransferase (adenine-specific)
VNAANDNTVDLRLGDWREVLKGESCDLHLADPPYGNRTHGGQRHGRRAKGYGPQDGAELLSARGISYAHWTPADVTEYVASWAPRTRGWFCAFTSHDLIPAYEAALAAAGRYVFAPISCVQNAMNVRLAGDGPSNWTTWLVTAAEEDFLDSVLLVSRPRTMRHWGALRGAYVGQSFDAGENALDRSKRAVAGAKPLWLMRAIVHDYSKPGDLIADPCAGGGTTLMSARLEGRRAIGAEIDPATYEKASARLADLPVETSFSKQRCLF